MNIKYINSSSGVFIWAPTEAQGPGQYTFQVVVTDNGSLDSENIVVTVDEINSAPVLGHREQDGYGRPIVDLYRVGDR